MSSTADYGEFSDPRLVAIYDTMNPIDGYRQFYLDLAKKLSAASIIDVGCGSGLLTGALAEEGYQMIGVDPSKAMLDLARQSACGQQVRWLEGDALRLEEFNADLAMMTGHVAQFHLDDQYWLDALKSIHKALRPGGYLAFESRNPVVQPWFIRGGAGHVDWPSRASARKVIDPVAGEIQWWVQILGVEGERVRYEIHYLFVESGEELVSTNELRFRTCEELSLSLAHAGFSVKGVCGDWDSRPASTESPEFIFVAERGDSSLRSE